MLIINIKCSLSRSIIISGQYNCYRHLFKLTLVTISSCIPNTTGTRVIVYTTKAGSSVLAGAVGTIVNNCNIITNCTTVI